MSVGEIADHLLEQGCGNLVCQRDGSCLHEAQSQRFLDDRLDGGYHRLEHIVQQVSHAHHEQYRQRGFLLQVVHLMKCVSRLFQNPSICQKYLHIVCKVTK